VQDQPKTIIGAERESSGRLMFRAMKKNLDGYPVVGRSGRMLGVRIQGRCADIPVADDAV
jgi:hypothetical protein